MILLRLVSWPYFRKHVLRTALTTAGIVLGVAVCFLFAVASYPVVTDFLSRNTPVLAEIARRIAVIDRFQDFTRGVASMGSRDPLRNEKQKAQTAFLKSKGINPLDDSKMTSAEAYALLTQDPAYAARLRIDRSNFALHWDNPRRAFHRDRAHYIGLMEQAEKAGLGKLELNPQLDMPDSTRHLT